MFQTPNYTFTRQFSPKTTVGLLHTSPPCSGLAACVKYFNISSSAANYRGNSWSCPVKLQVMELRKVLHHLFLLVCLRDVMSGEEVSREVSSSPETPGCWADGFTTLWNSILCAHQTLSCDYDPSFSNIQRYHWELLQTTPNPNQDICGNIPRPSHDSLGHVSCFICVKCLACCYRFFFCKSFSLFVASMKSTMNFKLFYTQ